mgnify:CR=1 FL=1|jgi:AAA+ superfamily predicted ATPase
MQEFSFLNKVEEKPVVTKVTGDRDNSDDFNTNTISLSRYEVNQFLYDFMKSFILSVYERKKKYYNFKVNSLIALENYYSPIVVPLNISETIDDKCIIDSSVIIAEVIYKSVKYYISIYSFIDNFRSSVNWNVAISSERKRGNNTRDLYNFLHNESISNSFYQKKFLTPIMDKNSLDDENNYKIKIAEIPEINLSDLFLSENVKNELERFIYCINNYDDLKINLRYLLSGAPGTGKTQIIKAIANEVKGKATFIFTHGGDKRVNLLFEFASLFEPCVICIDDLDFLVESRENIFLTSFGDFLQYLDGFVTKKIFIIATTNDKTLVDYAASRPGRFDMILDVENITRNNYLDLVRYSTKNKYLIDLFDDEILNLMQSKHVTGAFIVNLVKQIEIKYKMNESKGINEKIDLKRIINNTYNGFYNDQNKLKFNFGFNGI